MNDTTIVSQSGQTGVSLHSDGPATHTARINSGENVQTPQQVFGRTYKAPAVPKKETLISRAAVKKYALGIAKTGRAGKFTRVSESFFIGVEAELDSKIRQLVIQSEDAPVPLRSLTTSFARAKVTARLEKLAARIVYGKVMRHPSVGQTLKD